MPVKKLRDYCEAQEVKNRELKAERKAHWQSIGRVRRAAYYGLIALCIAILIAGIFTKTIHTALFASIVLLYALSLIVRGRRWRRRFIVGVVFSPIVSFPAAMAIGGLMMDMDYSFALRDQEIVRTHSAKVARDAEEFLANYRADKVIELGELEADHYSLQLGANDRLAYEGARRVFGLMHLSAPANLDTTAIMPLAEMLYADNTVVLYDKDLAKRILEEDKAVVEARFGMPAEDIPPEEHLAALPDYRGIFMLTCSFKNDGELLLVSGMPTAMQTDLRKQPAAEPFIEVCRSVARDKAKPEQSALSIIAQALR